MSWLKIHFSKTLHIKRQYWNGRDSNPPVLAKTSCFWRSFPASQGKECLLCFASLFPFVSYAVFSSLLSLDNLYLCTTLSSKWGCGNFGHGNALDCLDFIQTLHLFMLDQTPVQSIFIKLRFPCKQISLSKYVMGTNRPSVSFHCLLKTPPFSIDFDLKRQEMACKRPIFENFLPGKYSPRPV